MPISENIKRELSLKGMSQKELCEKTGISESAMSKYLSSERPLRSDVLIKIAKALEVSLYSLLEIPEKEGDTYDVCKTALLARNGSKLTQSEKNELLNLIFNHK